MSLRDDWVATLEAENENLRHRVSELEQLLGLRFEFPVHFGLSRSEGTIFGLLVKNPLVTKEMALSGLYLHKQDEAEIKIVDVYVCKIRKKLKAWDIQVETVWGQGYRLAPASRPIVEGIMADLNRPVSSAGAAA